MLKKIIETVDERFSFSPFEYTCVITILIRKFYLKSTVEMSGFALPYATYIYDLVLYTDDIYRDIAHKEQWNDHPGK